MSVYKDRGRLSETIESVLNQSFEDFEFIIVSDGSDNDTYEKILHFSSMEPRIKVYNNKNNIGLTKSLHRGVALSEAKFIARIDEGDLWHPKKLYLQLKFLEQNPDYVLVGSQYLNLCDANGTKTQGTKLPNGWPDVWKWLVSGKTPFIHSAILFRNNLLNYNQLATTSQDFEIYLRLSFLGKMANIPTPLIDYLRQEGSISHKKQEIQFFNHLIMHKQFIDSIKKNNQKEFAKNGVNFGKKLFLKRYREGYMRIVLRLIGHGKGRAPKKIVRTLLLPDLLLYKIYQKRCTLKHGEL